MKPIVALGVLLCLAMLALTFDARKDVAMYWSGVTTDQPISGAIYSVKSVSDKKADCHTSVDASKQDKPFVDQEFEPRLALDDKQKNERAFSKLRHLFQKTSNQDLVPQRIGDDELKIGTSFSKEFEPRSSASAYADNELKIETSFAKDFEPRPSASAYHNDKLTSERSITQDFKSVPSTTTDDKLENKKSFTKNFEPRPNLSAYTKKGAEKEEKSFLKDFEPRPNLSAYTGNDAEKEEKSFLKDFEPRPNLFTYTGKDEQKEDKSFVKPRPNASAYTDDIALKK